MGWGKGSLGGSPRVVSVPLVMVKLPWPIILVDEGWPSSLISVLVLNLRLVGALFPPRHHQHLKIPTNSSVTSWKLSYQMNSCIEGDYKYFISGSVKFLDRVCSFLPNTGNVVASFKFDFEGLSQGVRKEWATGAVVCQHLGFCR